MRKYNIIYLVIWLFLSISYSLAKKTVNFAVVGHDIYDNMYKMIEDGFNEYSNTNKLDIELKITKFTESNTTLGRISFDSSINSLIESGSSDYDMYIFDPIYTKKYATHFADLKNLIPPEHMSLYTSSENVAKVGLFKDQWVGLPLSMNFMVLYSNIAYLERYNKEVPKTWDELFETGKYILEQERQKNNNLVGYNGYFTNEDNSVCSLFDLIYSFRDTKESSLPLLNSQTAINALNKLIEIKTGLSSDEVFKSDDQFSTMAMYSENILFAKYWNLGNVSGYKKSVMPGKNDGVNGSCLTAFNVGISNYISSKQKKAAAKVLTYITSEDVQKNIVIKKFDLYSGLSSLYNDQEFCSTYDCQTAKEIQGICRPSSDTNDYDYYISKIVKNLNKILFEGKDVKEALMNIENLAEIFYFSKSTSVGLVFFILLLATFYVVFLSPLFLFIPRYENFFSFLSNDLWIIYSMGSLMVVSSEFVKFEELTDFKCQLNHLVLTIGISLVFIPILYKLIINYPKSNYFSELVRNYKYLFVFSLIALEVALNALQLISPYKVSDIITGNNKNFSMCKFENSTAGWIMALPHFLSILALYLCNCGLMYIEWNVEETKEELRTLNAVMIMDDVLITLLFIIEFIPIKDYVIYYSLHAILIIAFSICNQIYIFIIRICVDEFNSVSMSSDNSQDREYLFNDDDNCEDGNDAESFI